jgi:CheY-like chemotaxis protein
VGAERSVAILTAARTRRHEYRKRLGMDARPVLVVDDDPDNRSLMVDILRLEGYAVATASHGREALKCLLDFRPFVILLDLDMPVMDGRTFRQCQLRLPSPLCSIPVILCSGSNDADKVTAELCPFAYVSKPLSDFRPLLEQVEAASQLSASCTSHSSPPCLDAHGAHADELHRTYGEACA